ncbi:MAG: winged helix-turn-helix transcriptional regulator [Candidatus Omnitrophica bacterium]|nr:winged helix-turn-helix transcriptional regulator [Candidatus Omnitrophota bacterium]
MPHQGLNKNNIQEKEVCVCFSLRKAARVITQIYDEVVRPLGYKATQITLLGVVNQNQPVTVTGLAALTDTDRTTLTRNLKLLERDQLIRITRGQDRRQRSVVLTENGRQLLAKAYPLWRETQKRIIHIVGEKDLYDLLLKVNHTLEKIKEA